MPPHAVRADADPRSERLRRAGPPRLAAALRGLAEGEAAWTAPLVEGWGRLFLAATRHGACRLELLDRRASPDASVARVASDLRDHGIRRDDRALAPLVAAVRAWLSRPGPRRLDLPLDLGGTEFQRRTWRELLGVAPGTTTTYGEIARRLGKPDAARAVGAAIGANAVAIAVPCHRVVAAQGALGGFRWGLPAKRRLLALEGAR